MKLDEELVFKMMNLVKCVNCNAQFSYVPGKISDLVGKNDNDGKPLTELAKKNYAENRFKCLSCKVE